MRFPPAFLDDIRNRIPISAVVGRRVAWDRRKSNPGKGDYWACCPFHGEKTPSFHADDRKGIYHCFGCKASGDIFTFLVEKEGVPFPEAVARLAAEAGLPMPTLSEEEIKREERRASLYDVMELAAQFFEGELQAARGARARGYLADRGLAPAVQKEFRLGFAPDDRSALRSHLAQKGVSLEQMIEAGLIVSGDDIPVAYDRFRDRIMFPIRDARGKVIAFGGRALSKDAPAKYLNSPETALFHKGRVLYNLDRARGPAHDAGAIIAVEGYVDVIAMHRAGLPYAVAPLGTALTEDQLALLWRIAPEPVLCFDGDAAGLRAAWRVVDLALPLLRPGHSLRIAVLPEGQDPDDLLKSAGAAALTAAVGEARPLADMLWQRALDENDRATPERRAQFERDLNARADRIGNATVRRHYLADFAERLDKLWRGANGKRRLAKGRRPPFATRHSPLAKSQKPWETPTPPSPQLRVLASASQPHRLAERRERMILLSAVNHPELLHEFLDELVAMELSSRELDTLRARIVDGAALGAGLEGSALKDHLTESGLGPLLERLETQARQLNEWFLGSGAAACDARTGIRQMIALHRKTVTLDRELRTAEAAFAADPTEENLMALNAVRDELSSHAGSEAQIEGFGAASGRAADVIT
jgi:DNA primase